MEGFNKKLITLILLVLLSMLLLGAKSIDSLDWKEYKNDYYTFEYPNGWKFREMNKEGYCVMLAPPGTSGEKTAFFIRRRVGIPPNYSEKELHKDIQQRTMFNAELLKQKKITFKEAPAYKKTFISTFKGETVKTTKIYSYVNNSLVTIGYMGSVGEKYNYISKIADKIIKSLTINNIPFQIYASGSSEEIKKAAANGADINKRIRKGLTPLIWAASYNQQQKAIATLINLGAKINHQAGDEEKTALDFAIEKNQNEEVIKTLIKQGADVNYQNRFGWTPLMRAISEGRSLELIKYLVNQGAKINIRHNTGGSPLTEAIIRGDLEVIKFLLDSGADINMQNQAGETPLIFAAQHSKNPKVITTLINQGAKASIKDGQGKKAIDYLEKNDALQETKAYLALVKKTIREDKDSFGALQKFIHESSGYYQLKAKLFQEKRNQLGSDFEAKVCKAVKGDIESCRFFGKFLLDPEYLHGNKSRPKLGFKIFEIGLNITPTNDNMTAERVSLLVTAAIENKNYGNLKKAVSLKRKVEALLAEKPKFSGAFPVLDETDRIFYESIDTSKK